MLIPQDMQGRSRDKSGRGGGEKNFWRGEKKFWTGELPIFAPLQGMTFLQVFSFGGGRAMSLGGRRPPPPSPWLRP